MATKKNFLDFDLPEAKSALGNLGVETYRAAQVFDWVYGKGVYDFLKMRNLPKATAHAMDSHFSLDVGEVCEKHVSKEDGSIKLLIKMKDGQLAETVYIPRGKRRTVCVSSQVGCKFGCVFCASGQAGFARNLKASEIISQVLLAKDAAKQQSITHVVFMGMGEPLDNYKEVMDAVTRLNDKSTLGLGARKITISTSGLVPKIDAFRDKKLQLELAVSLHGPNDAIRSQLMPINRRWPVKELIDECRRYTEETNRVITFEYLLADGLNCSANNAQELTRLLKGLKCKVNLIPLNPIKEFPYERPSYPTIKKFQSILESRGIRTTVRFSRGNDIDAACGQLRRRMFEKNRVGK
jgi:23S rRNA (adenine2503-C2)-methyltransferase